MVQDIADRELCRIVHSSGNELIILSRELADAGVFEVANKNGPMAAMDLPIFSGIVPRTKLGVTTVYVTPAEEEENLNPDFRGPKAQVFVIGTDARFLAMLCNFYGNPAIDFKFQVRMIKLLSHIIPTINRYLRGTVTKDYIYLVGSSLTENTNQPGNNNVLWVV